MFRDYVEKLGLPIEIVDSEDQTTHTAANAAKAHGVPVSNIIKSLLFKHKDADQFIMALVPGDRRMNMDRLSEYVGGKIRMATPDEVKSVTGYSIGGVPPFGHASSLTTYVMDGFDGSVELLGAAGSAHTIFKCTLEDLIKWTDAEVLEF